MSFVFGRKRGRRSLSERLDEVARYAHTVVGGEAIRIEDQEQLIGGSSEDAQIDQPERELAGESSPIATESTPLLSESAQLDLEPCPSQQVEDLNQLNELVCNCFGRFFLTAQIREFLCGRRVHILVSMVITTIIVFLGLYFACGGSWSRLGCTVQRVVFSEDRFYECSTR